MEYPSAAIDRLDPAAGAGLRAAITYDGEDVEFVTVRDDVEAANTRADLEETARQLALKGFDDPPDQPELGRLGRLGATVRWFDDVVVCQIPVGEWAGLLLAYDHEDVTDRGELTDEVLSVAADLRGQSDDDAGSLSERFD